MQKPVYNFRTMIKITIALDNVREAFKIFDRNKDGMISLQELKKVTDILGTVLSKEEVDDFMKEADKDGDGTLDIDEFVRCLLQYG